jgi:hypothetical protein
MAKLRKKHAHKWRRVLDSIANGLRPGLRWSYLLWALVCVFAVLIIVKHTATVRWLGKIDWVLVKDYLAVIVVWPTAVLALGLIFMYKFNDSIREFLGKMDRLKAPGIEISQQQATTPSIPNDEKEQKTVENLESKVDGGVVTLTNQQVDELVKIVETMDFKFLNLHLVQNTKSALRIMAQIEVKKSTFLQVYQVPPQITDQVAERQAILTALFEAQLIYEEDDVLKPTDKGLRFLAFIGMPIQQIT